MTTTDTETPRYWVRGGLHGKAIGVTREHPDGRSEAWAWNRWVPIPNARPRYDDILVDEVDETTALRVVKDPDLFDDEWGAPDPEQANAESADREMAALRDEGKTYAEIGLRYGISRQRAHQRVKRARP